jgi:hypothetical protein
VGRCLSVIDVGTNGVEGNLSNLIAFTAGDFRTTQTTRNQYFDSSAIKAHNTSHRLSHGSAMADALFKLNANVLGYQLRI